jgi:hypothetical protein
VEVLFPSSDHESGSDSEPPHGPTVWTGQYPLRSLYERLCMSGAQNCTPPDAAHVNVLELIRFEPEVSVTRRPVKSSETNLMMTFSLHEFCQSVW